MAGFNNIIGHEEIIRHLKNAIENRESFPFLYFYRKTRIRKKASCNNLCNDSSGVSRAEQNPARNATHAKRLWARIILISLW